MRTLQRVRAVCAKDKKLLQECKGIIQRLLPGATVLLYGSVARGRQGPESDYDVLVLTENLLSTREEEEVGDALFDLELEHEVVISLLFFTKEQWGTSLYRAMPLHREVERDGIVL
ncbi:MAG: nucleotidyltransferase domain-containing protein [Planctomycetes bacterium]|nr:nucleotidyltransferase domain-containing protein [Planctomycetota bacterium]MBM4080433.1 nucleotidyltransferase domain-containing protein [Planctomycetota bacterium]MBM4083580.1 nucleotidyltransferase domain-containing protein [Planctomycetota bacterium]